ncbi:DUF4861 family protein [Paraflavitalea speifideaquila]|uniref:DUF4861 family protein n=1 Tax=Paraflavitalea speifideaquila TaxID=3076558 RepID=UPI0028EDD499|nr:DUF4861 family protein [Paraflavitalea speifideiaquila]
MDYEIIFFEAPGNGLPAPCPGPYILPRQKNTQLIIENNGVERPQELIVIKRPVLETKVDSLSAGKYLLLGEGGRPLVVQYDDYDGDGNWDELAFLLSLKAGEKKYWMYP